MTRNCLLSLKLLRFGDTTWKVWPISLILLQVIKTLSIFLLPKYWPRGKHGGLSTSSSSILSSGSALVILALNQMLSLDDGTFTSIAILVNSHNFKPIFTQEQLVVSIWATILLFPSFCAATVMDLDTLHRDILLALPSDPIATHLHRWPVVYIPKWSFFPWQQNLYTIC